MRTMGAAVSAPLGLQPNTSSRSLGSLSRERTESKSKMRVEAAVICTLLVPKLRYCTDSYIVLPLDTFSSFSSLMNLIWRGAWRCQTVSIQQFIEQCAQLPDCGGASLGSPVCGKLWSGFCSVSYNTERKTERNIWWGVRFKWKSSVQGSTDGQRAGAEARCHTSEAAVRSLFHGAATSNVYEPYLRDIGAG